MVDNKSAGNIYETFKLISTVHDKALDLNMDGVATVETIKAMYREYDKLVQAARRARNEASDDDDDEEEEDDDDEWKKRKWRKGDRKSTTHCRSDFILQSFPLEVLRAHLGHMVGKKKARIHNCSGKTPK